MVKYRNIKIYVEDEETSKKVQEILFKDGCKFFSVWEFAQHTSMKYWFVDGHGSITFSPEVGHFEESPYKEVEYYEMVISGLKEVETIELWGKRYRVADVAEALKLFEESRTTKTSSECSLHYRGQIYGDWS